MLHISTSILDSRLHGNDGKWLWLQFDFSKSIVKAKRREVTLSVYSKLAWELLLEAILHQRSRRIDEI